jgi:DnaJ-domain-containing protein 1
VTDLKAAAPRENRVDFIRTEITRGELVKVLYRLGRSAASGVLTMTVAGTARAEIFVLRRGAVVISDGDAAKRTLVGRLARLASVERLALHFESGVAAYPPGASHAVPLATWAREHLERQLDGALADALLRELAGIRLSIRVELAPDPGSCDEADRRMLAALAAPRRLDQVWSLARTPRFRLLSFIHFMRAVDALDVEGVVADRSVPTRAIDPRRDAARRMLGLDAAADLEAIKRAYRRLARELHPDLQPEVNLAERRLLEQRFAEVTAAYEALL